MLYKWLQFVPIKEQKKKRFWAIPFRCNYKMFDLKLVKYIDIDPIDLEDQLQLYVWAHGMLWKLFKLN